MPFAPDASYGRPEDLKALVEAAHELGLMVLLDVVYNHFGPEGNYYRVYAPQFFTATAPDAVGRCHQLRRPRTAVRCANSSSTTRSTGWTEFHFDGLRLDAVHAIVDDGPPVHILEELAQRVRARMPGRAVHLLLENEHNQAPLARTRRPGNTVRFDAQWNDDLHHVLHVAATGETKGYYADYCGRAERLGRALAEGFAFQGELMAYRGSARGEPSAQLPPAAFVAFIQNHDQIGNRALGERIAALAPTRSARDRRRCTCCCRRCRCCSWARNGRHAEPFLFFCDFGAELGEAVVEGRRQEFARFPAFHDQAARERIPDPQAEATFRERPNSTGRGSTTPTRSACRSGTGSI